MANEEAEKVEKARRMGRAWQCLRCRNEEGKPTVDRKCRIEEHLMKVHLSLTEVPFYCKLCLFRCQRREQLDHHVNAHKRHMEMAVKRNILDHTPCLVVNAKPHVFGPADYGALTSEESLQHFMGFRGTSTPSAVEESSIVGSPLYTAATAGAVQSQTQQQPSEVTEQVPDMAAYPPVSQIQGPLGASQTSVPSQVPAPLGVTKPVPTPVPVQVSFGAVQSATTPSHVQVPLGAPMSMSSPSQTLVSLRAAQSAAITATDYQTISGLTDVLNTIIGTQQLLLTQCQQQQQTALVSLTNMPGSSNVPEIGAPDVKTTGGSADVMGQDVVMKVLPAPTGITPNQSTAESKTEMSKASMPPANTDELPLDLTVPSPDMKDESEEPLNLSSSVREVEEYIPQYVPTPKGAFRPIVKAKESGAARSDSIITVSEERAEDVLGQLLPDEDMTIKSPTKRLGEENTPRECKRQRKEESQEGLPVNVHKISEQTLVKVVDTFRVVMEKNVAAVKATGELMKDSMHMMGKMVDAMNRMRHTLEDNEKEAQRREERRREDEKSREVESRIDYNRWRQDDRMMDDRKREADRKGDDRKREADRKERRDREDRGRREEKTEKENRPALKSMVEVAKHNRR